MYSSVSDNYYFMPHWNGQFTAIDMLESRQNFYSLWTNFYKLFFKLEKFVFKIQMSSLNIQKKKILTKIDQKLVFVKITQNVVKFGWHSFKFGWHFDENKCWIILSPSSVGSQSNLEHCDAIASMSQQELFGDGFIHSCIVIILKWGFLRRQTSISRNASMTIFL